MSDRENTIHWGRYVALLVAGLALFLASVAAVMHYIQVNRYDSVARDAYDYHVLLQAQQALDRLVYRIELASMDANSISSTENRPSLNDQLEIVWCRFDDLLQSQSAKRLQQIPGLPEFVAQVIETLGNFQETLITPQPDYLAYLEQVRHLSGTFSRTFTSLPAHLLPIQEQQQKEILRQQYWYYSALGLSSLIVLLLYVVALREIARLRQGLSMRNQD
jgi:hypothetical protein